MRWKRGGRGRKEQRVSRQTTGAQNPSAVGGQPASAAAREERVAFERLRDGLEMRGLPKEFAEALGKRLEIVVHERGDQAIDALLDGAAATFRLHAETSEGLERQLGELRELERILGAFAGELSKLDETLEVLVAYARRMRSTAPAPEKLAAAPSGSRLH